MYLYAEVRMCATIETFLFSFFFIFSGVSSLAVADLSLIVIRSSSKVENPAEGFLRQQVRDWSDAADGPREPADDGCSCDADDTSERRPLQRTLRRCRCCCLRCFRGPLPVRTSTTGPEVRGGYGCDPKLRGYGCYRSQHRQRHRCGSTRRCDCADDAQRRPQRKPRVTDDASPSHSRGASVQPVRDDSTVRVHRRDGDDSCHRHRDDSRCLRCCCCYCCCCCSAAATDADCSSYSSYDDFETIS